MANTTGKKFGGRTKGATNKDTADIRKSFQLLIENNLDQLDRDIKALEPKDRVKAILDVSRYVIPILKATEITDVSDQIGFTPVVINITQPEEIKKIINKLENNY